MHHRSEERNRFPPVTAPIECFSWDALIGNQQVFGTGSTRISEALDLAAPAGPVSAEYGKPERTGVGSGVSHGVVDVVQSELGHSELGEFDQPGADHLHHLAQTARGYMNLLRTVMSLRISQRYGNARFGAARPADAPHQHCAPARTHCKHGRAHLRSGRHRRQKIEYAVDRPDGALADAAPVVVSDCLRVSPFTRTA